MDAPTGSIGDGLTLADGEVLWLLGQPSLDDLLAFARHDAAGGGGIPSSELAAQWRAANELFHSLEREEAGEAERARIRPLRRPEAARAERLREDPRHRASFDAVPTRIALVELDRLIVSRCDIAVPPAASTLAAMAPADLFDFCLPHEAPRPPLRILRLGPDRMLFACQGDELRAGDAALLDTAACAGLAVEGAPALSGVGVPIAHASPLMSAIHSDGRLVLHNGHKRALALLAAGVDFAPCLIHDVTRTDELELVARDAVIDRPEFYFRAQRPPLLRDFLDQRLVRRFAVRRRETIVEIELKIKIGPATDCEDALR